MKYKLKVHLNLYHYFHHLLHRQLIKKKVLENFREYLLRQMDELLGKHVRNQLRQFLQQIRRYYQEMRKLNKYEQIALGYCHQLGLRANLRKYYAQLERDYVLISLEEIVRNAELKPSRKSQLQDTYVYLNKYHLFKESTSLKSILKFREQLGDTGRAPPELDAPLPQRPFFTQLDLYIDDLRLVQLPRFWQLQTKQTFAQPPEQLTALQHAALAKGGSPDNANANTSYLNESKLTMDATAIEGLNNSLEHPELSQSLLHERSGQDVVLAAQTERNPDSLRHPSVLVQTPARKQPLPKNTAKSGAKYAQRQIGRNYQVLTDQILAFRPYFKPYPSLKQTKEMILEIIEFPFQEFLLNQKTPQNDNPAEKGE